MDGTAAIHTATPDRTAFERFMAHLAEADRLLEQLQSGAMLEGGFDAIRDPRSPIHHLDEVMLSISDARAAMIAYVDGQPVK